MALFTATLGGLTFTANEIAAAAAYKTNPANLLQVANQAIRDARTAVNNLDICLETGNKTAVDTILLTLG